jgi:hypothetical protein
LEVLRHTSCEVFHGLDGTAPLQCLVAPVQSARRTGVWGLLGTWREGDWGVEFAGGSMETKDPALQWWASGCRRAEQAVMDGCGSNPRSPLTS